MTDRWNSSRASSRVTPEQFREAPNTNAEGAPRAARGLPTESQRKANRKVLSEALGASPERLDAVMNKYRPRFN